VYALNKDYERTQWPKSIVEGNSLTLRLIKFLSFKAASEQL